MPQIDRQTALIVMGSIFVLVMGLHIGLEKSG
jgi:hypothetical protein